MANVSSQESDPPIFTRYLSDLNERRIKGICLWCDEIQTPSHNCFDQDYIIHLINDVGYVSEEDSEEIKCDVVEVYEEKNEATYSCTEELLIHEGSDFNKLKNEVCELAKIDGVVSNEGVFGVKLEGNLLFCVREKTIDENKKEEEMGTGQEQEQEVRQGINCFVLDSQETKSEEMMLKEGNIVNNISQRTLMLKFFELILFPRTGIGGEPTLVANVDPQNQVEAAIFEEYVLHQDFEVQNQISATFLVLMQLQIQLLQVFYLWFGLQSFMQRLVVGHLGRIKCKMKYTTQLQFNNLCLL